MTARDGSVMRRSRGIWGQQVTRYSQQRVGAPFTLKVLYNIRRIQAGTVSRGHSSRPYALLRADNAQKLAQPVKDATAAESGFKAVPEQSRDNERDPSRIMKRGMGCKYHYRVDELWKICGNRHAVRNRKRKMRDRQYGIPRKRNHFRVHLIGLSWLGRLFSR